jgi:excisionase family DNA binding protein
LPRLEEVIVAHTTTQSDFTNDTIDPDARLSNTTGHLERRGPRARGSARNETFEQRLLLTVPEAAHRLSIGRSLLYELLAAGQLESIHVGRLRRIPADAVVAFIDVQRRQHRDDAI